MMEQGKADIRQHKPQTIDSEEVLVTVGCNAVLLAVGIVVAWPIVTAIANLI